MPQVLDADLFFEDPTHLRIYIYLSYMQVMAVFFITPLTAQLPQIEEDTRRQSFQQQIKIDQVKKKHNICMHA